MPTLIAGVVAVIVLYLLLQMFRAANPVVLARAIKIAGGMVALAVAAFIGFRGELAIACRSVFSAPDCWAGHRSAARAFGFIGGLFGAQGDQRSAENPRRFARSFSI